MIHSERQLRGSISSLQTTMKVDGSDWCKIYGHKWSSTKEKFCVNCGVDLVEFSPSEERILADKTRRMIEFNNSLISK